MMPSVPVKIALAPGCVAPEYASDGAAGLDLRARVPVDLMPGERALVPTGLFLEIPPGYEGQVRPRSGLAIRNGLSMVNSPGTIDCDYRGEVQVILINHGQERVWLDAGERIAQLVICPVVRADLQVVESLTETARGGGGFGSTGTR